MSRLALNPGTGFACGVARGTRRGAWAGLVLAAAIFQSAPGWQAAGDARSELSALVHDLGSESYEVRWQAYERLRTHPDARLVSFEDVLLDPTLDAEQRARVTALARGRFGVEPRAALGIRYDNAWNRARRNAPAVIERAIDGFDSARVLRPGDAVVSFDGVRVTDRVNFRTHILSYDPGDVALLGIERDDAVLDVLVTMGSQDQLNTREVRGDNQWGIPAASNTISESDLDDSWAVRLGRKGLRASPETLVLDGELSGSRWRETWSIEGVSAARAGSGSVSVSPGGSARGGGPLSVREFSGGEYAVSARPGRWGQDRDPVAEQINQFRRTIEDIDARIADLRSRLDGLAPEELARMRMEALALQQLIAQRDVLSATLDALEMQRRASPPRGQPRR
ncbi:MAG: PDZ domain-containing protein [Phycisphaeraceae bacterium]|nr:PDZ domain-containing protein [Phycisphaerae bacterium]MBX3391885.1 PDZ domain-containing protein [Phycisphaeraceae bacterium]